MAIETEQQTATPGGIKLKGRVALVTGGTRGIGAAIAHSLANQEAIVAAGYSANREAAERFLENFERRGGRGSLHQGNIGSVEDCERVVNEVIDQHGRLDILVNNAGITVDKTVLKMTQEDWYKVLAVNLSGAFFMSKPALKHMLERGTGRIINISSLIGQEGAIGQANYAASKSALFGLTKSLALEAAAELAKTGKLTDDTIGLTVNCVAPGYIETEMMSTVPQKIVDRIRSRVPVGRLGRADEVARLVHFICADASSYITGQVISVNGGIDLNY